MSAYSDLKQWRLTSIGGTDTGATYHGKDQSVIGEILKIEYKYNNTTATGSVLVLVSGTNEVIDSITDFSADTQTYTGSVTGGKYYPSVCGELFIVNSGTGGTGSTISAINILYK